MLMLILVPFLVLLAAMLLSLYQASAVNQGASWLGQRITSSGTACTDGSTDCDWIANFKDQMAGLGVVVSPADTIAVSITSPDGTVRYFDQTQPTLVPTTAYGDTVMVRFIKPLTGGLFAGSGFQDIIENMPGSSDTWVGVAQLEKGPGSSGIPVVADFGLNYTSTVTSDVPSAYWRLESGGPVLNETSGDRSKFGTIGPSVGTGFPTLITAGTDAAFNFDGSSGSWLSVPESTALDAGPGGAFSVEFWLSFSSNCATSEEPILVRGSTSIVVSPATGCLGNTLSVSLGSGLQLSATPAILRDSPHHIVVTYDGTHRANGYVEVHIFIDGVNAPLSGGPSDNRFAASTVSGWAGFSGELFWAAQNSGSSARFIGSLDELALYARPLTSDLVALHYVAGTKNGNVIVDAGRTIYFQDLSNGLPSSWQWNFDGGTSNAENPTFAWPSASVTPKNVSLTVGSNTKSISVVVVQPSSVSPTFGFDYASLVTGLTPVSYWRLDEGSGTTMVDAMGHVAGTYAGAVSFGPGLLVGSSDQGLILGSSAFSVSAPDNAALDLGSFSVSLQIKRTRTGVAEDLWSRDNVSLGISSDNRVELRLPGGTVRSNIILTSTNSAYDIVATYAGGQAHLFVNGADVSSIVGSIPASLTLAGITYLGGTTAPFEGSLDEVAIYSRALSAADVGSLDTVAHQNAMTVAISAAVAFVNLTGGTPLYVFWDFGDGSGSTETSPTHHYNGVGTYTVRLTVETANGWGSVVSQNLVTVHL